MPEKPFPPKHRRADAARNRHRILDAAREAFADPEAAVSMADVARRAGVGQATLYRNFTSRRELLEALYMGEIETLVAVAGNAEEASPGAQLIAWLERFYAYFTSKRSVAAELLEHTDAEDPFFNAGRTRVMDAGRPVLQAAQDAGEIRPDLTLEQVLDLVVAIAKVPGTETHREPILRAALDGLRAGFG